MKKDGPRVAVMDYGCKKNTIRELRARCSKVKIFPSRASAEDVKAFQPHGILLSNGPGDPALVEKAVDTVRELIGWRYIFGICMGHQILAQALGGKTYKLKFGHRGSNHPIQDQLLGRIYMTSQNHGYNVDMKTLPEDVKVSHANLNDQTVAGICDLNRKVMSVQFHPESRPGPHDSTGLVRLLREAAHMNFDTLVEKVIQYYTSPAYREDVNEAKNQFQEVAGSFDEAAGDFENKMAQFTDWYVFTRKLKRRARRG